MMGAFDTILCCSVGGLQVTSYSKTAEGRYDEAGLRTSTARKLTVKGYVEAADVAAQAAALAALEAEVNEFTGDFTISAGEATLETFDASDSGMPLRLTLAYGDTRGPTYQDVTIEVETEEPAGGNLNSVTSETEKCSTERNLENLATIRWSGTIKTGGATSASGRFLSNHVPDAIPSWTLTYSYEKNETDTECRYEIVETQLVAAYPVSGMTGSRVVDGEYTLETSYDNNNRQVQRHQYSYVGPYALAFLNARHDALRSAGGLQSASISVTTHKTQQATGTFEVLTSRAGVAYGEVIDLLEMQETITHGRTAPLLRDIQYAGTTPLIVQEAASGFLYEQAGRAVGFKRYPQPAPYSFDVANLAEEPAITFTRGAGDEYVTEWRFRFLYALNQDKRYPHARSACPGFYV
jgi:hypothetical protein